MATITAAGVGSGLDVGSIITQLMKIEQQPLTALATKQSGIRSQISAYGQLSSALSTLKTAATALNTPSKVNVFKATFSDTTLATATATSSAAAGTYDIQVTNLAKAHTLSSSAYTDSNTVVGDGTLQITSGSNSFSITVDGTNHTLAGIRDAINASSSNTSVTASIVNDTSGSRLVLAAKNTGAANAISVVATESGTAGLAQLSYTAGAYNLTQGNPAQNALLSVNGVSISSASNTVSSAITGVTFTLAKDSGSATLTVARDSAALTQVANDFASAYSKLASTVKSLTKFDTTSKTGSALTGDGTTSLIMNRIRSTLSTIPSSVSGATYQTLAEVGMSIQADGSMSVDTTKLQSAIDNNFTALQNVLSAYGSSISSTVTDLTDSDGAITSRVDSLNGRIRSLDSRKLDIEARLTRIEASYRRQFSALDALMGSMNTTSSFLTQQLAKL